ncbi:MAG: hypothetical protein KatS3mg082_1681 [Nitrospiraceae bacterium]|nr:MAG: hypothetical protein KatS3mg082_1681 [Nitrospiraceae bacterium]
MTTHCTSASTGAVSPLCEEMPDRLHEGAKATILAISAARLNALEAVERLARAGLPCDLLHLVWLKPFKVTRLMLESLAKTGVGLVVDADFAIAGTARSIAYELMLKSGMPVYALGLEDRTAGFAPFLDNVTPTAQRIVETVRNLVEMKEHGTLPMTRRP